MKIMADTFGKRPVLELMYASLLPASERWCGSKIRASKMKQLEMIGLEARRRTPTWSHTASQLATKRHSEIQQGITLERREFWLGIGPCARVLSGIRRGTSHAAKG